MSNAITVSNGQQEIKIYTVQNRGHAVYQLSYYQAGIRQRRTFADLSDAKREAKVILGQLAITTGQTERLSFSDMESYTIARQKLAPTGVPLHVAAELFAEVHTTLAGRSLIDAVRFFADAHPTRHAQTLLSALIEPFAESRIAMGTHSDYVADIKRQLGRLVEAFPAKSAPDLRSVDLDKWMGALKSHSITKNNVRKILITFGNWCKLHGYLPNNRPTAFDGMITYKVPPTKIGIYTPAELSLMLHTVADAKPDLLPWVVCAAFTGARVSELSKLEWQHLNFERSFIEVASLKVRTKARRLVPMCDAMKAWLLPHRQKSGPINLYVAPHAALARVLAQNTQPPLPLCDNGFRHSYISYRIAAIHDTARVALEAGNSADVIFQHYRELVSSEDATAWFGTVQIPAFMATAGLDLDALGSHENRFPACGPLLAELLNNDPTTPTALVVALFIISVLAEPEPTEELWNTLTQSGIAIPPDASLADLALTLWLRAPDKARQLYIERVHLRTRSFVTHAARTFRKTSPMRPVNDSVLSQLRQSIEVFFLKHHRPAGCQVFAQKRGKEHWFMIRRGDGFKRIATLSADGRGESAGFFAEAFDVIVVDPNNEHLHIHAEGVRATRMYSALFGFVLYGRETHFEDCTRFTLDPLRNLGRAALVCTDVPGIHSVHLIELHYEAGLAVVRKKSTKAPDVFAALDEDHIELNTELRLLRAVLLFQFKNDPKPRRVTIKPHNQTSYEHDEDSRVVSEWLTLREFAKTELPPKEVQDVAHLEIA